MPIKKIVFIFPIFGNKLFRGQRNMNNFKYVLCNFFPEKEITHPRNSFECVFFP